MGGVTDIKTFLKGDNEYDIKKIEDIRKSYPLGNSLGNLLEYSEQYKDKDTVKIFEELQKEYSDLKTDADRNKWSANLMANAEDTVKELINNTETNKGTKLTIEQYNYIWKKLKIELENKPKSQQKVSFKFQFGEMNVKERFNRYLDTVKLCPLKRNSIEAAFENLLKTNNPQYWTKILKESSSKKSLLKLLEYHQNYLI
jgi:hypothetical protein